MPRDRTEDAPPLRLTLVTPPIADGEAFAPLLRAAVEAGDVAAVLLALDAPDDATAKAITKVLGPIVQKRDAALIIDGYTAIVARSGADGVHVDTLPALRSAMDSFKPERIVGCGRLRSRHDAMAAAEAGADYVMFGEPNRDGRLPPLADVADRVAWWAEVMAVPCVAYAPSLDQVALFADAGADFIALGGAGLWSAQNGPDDIVRSADLALSQRRRPHR